MTAKRTEKEDAPKVDPTLRLALAIASGGDTDRKIRAWAEKVAAEAANDPAVLAARKADEARAREARKKALAAELAAIEEEEVA